jgi:hypothetical protein
MIAVFFTMPARKPAAGKIACPTCAAVVGQVGNLPPITNRLLTMPCPTV